MSSILNRILEKIGIIRLVFYITAIGYGIFFWFLCNVIFRNHRNRY